MTDEEVKEIKDTLKEFQAANKALELKIALLELKIEQLTKALDGVASSMSWLPKTIGTILVAALLTLLFKFGGPSGAGQ